jgi:hypothetical protein
MYIDYDLDDVEVLSENQNEITDKVLNMYNNDFITLNEGRERLGWGMLDYGDELKSKIMTTLLAGDSGDMQANEITMTETTATVQESTIMNNESTVVAGD